MGKQLDEYLKQFGKSCPDDMPTLSYGRKALDLFLSSEGKIETINRSFIASTIDKNMMGRPGAGTAQLSHPVLARETVKQPSNEEANFEVEAKKRVNIGAPPAEASAQPSFLFRPGDASTAPRRDAPTADHENL